MTTQLDEGYRDIGTAEVHDVDDGKHQVAVDFPIVIDSYRSDFGPSAFEEGFRQQMPAMCANHNQDNLIGHAVSAQSLPNLHRLVGQFSDFDDVPQARRAFAHVRDGDYPGFSFHFVRGESIKHPNVRGAMRYTKARMIEFGPVLAPSIPGAIATGLRSEEPTLDIPTIEELVNLSKLGVLNDEGLRSAIAEHYPNLREHITIAQAKSVEQLASDLQVTHDEAIAKLATELGLRSMTIAIDSDGAVTTDGTPLSDDATELAKSVDLCLGTALSDIGEFDTATLPDNIQQAIMHVEAGSRATAELLDIMGITPEVVEAVVAAPTETSADGNRSDEGRQADIDKALAKLGQRVA